MTKVKIERTIPEQIRIELEFAKHPFLTEKIKNAFLEISKALENLNDQEIDFVIKGINTILLGSTISPLDLSEESKEWEYIDVGGGNMIQSNKRVPSIVKMNGNILFFNPFIWIDVKTGETFTGGFADFIGYVTLPKDIKQFMPFQVELRVDKEKNVIIDEKAYQMALDIYSGKIKPENPSSSTKKTMVN